MESSTPNFSRDFYLSRNVSSTIYTVEFDYSMYSPNGNYMGDLSLRASADDGSSWTTLWTKSGNQGEDWGTARLVDLDSEAYTAIR